MWKLCSGKILRKRKSEYDALNRKLGYWKQRKEKTGKEAEVSLFHVVPWDEKPTSVVVSALTH